MRLWYAGLGLPWKKNLYYAMFDMNTIASPAKRKVPAEQKLIDLAERGVVLIPANRFFSKEDRTIKDHKNFVRGSLPNLTNEQVSKAAGVIREYLAE
jgi:DNA-binding transcriptional MocR family regulator